MNKFPKIKLADYLYELPNGLIADHPAKHREESKLLFYNKGKIQHCLFKEITRLIPGNSTLFLNDTRVIPARLHFQRKTGAVIEIFLLNPVSHGGKIELTMHSRNTCEWECMIGNLKKWKDGEVLNLKINDITVNANLDNREKGGVKFTWDNNITFSTLLEVIGNIPLPPYIHRDTELSDKVRYQTVYSKTEGAVAAPTAGLHFSKTVLATLKGNKIKLEYLTLHVGAGTFQPISGDSIEEHPMHAEKMVVNRQNIEEIGNSNFPIAVGTTSMRTIESLYWYGLKLQTDKNASFYIEKDFPYKVEESISIQNSMENILKHMERNGLDQLQGITELFIIPGYKFKIVKGLVTNYHLPGSTLILLVAAFVGKDWKNVYQSAKENNYRFLSYGDSSFLLP